MEKSIMQLENSVMMEIMIHMMDVVPIAKLNGDGNVGFLDSQTLYQFALKNVVTDFTNPPLEKPAMMEIIIIMTAAMLSVKSRMDLNVLQMLLGKDLDALKNHQLFAVMEKLRKVKSAMMDSPTQMTDAALHAKLNLDGNVVEIPAIVSISPSVEMQLFNLDNSVMMVTTNLAMDVVSIAEFKMPTSAIV